ncbi:acyltransferase family protein [Candidatus Saccharibacteria bacterium]|nr:acyltransferase family protein [Candidatus Saccharibacteria bacterium]
MKEVKKRILWVDIAKALTILSVPISHTIPLEYMLRAVIFSFHMPLFFILSGFTTRLAEDWKTLVKRLKKNFLYLIIPTFLVLMIFTLTDTLSKGDITGYFPNLGFWLHEFFIEKYPNGFYTASAVWFLVAMFWAKLVMDLVNVTFKTEKNGIIFFFLGILGVCMGIFEFRPPFFFDLGLVGAFFMYIGMLWRKHEAFIKKYTLLIAMVAGIYWFAHVMRGDFIEMWTRFYAGYEVAFLTAFAGTFLVCQFAMMIEESAKKAGKYWKKFVDALVTLGKTTMLLYMVHCLDTAFFEWAWDLRDGSDEMMWLSCFIRLSLNIAVYVVLYNSIRLVKAIKLDKTLAALKK